MRTLTAPRKPGSGGTKSSRKSGIAKKLGRKLLAVITAVAGVVAFAIPVYADGYIVRTTVQTVTTTNGVVTGYTTQTYDSPVQYGSPVYTTPVTTPAVATTPAVTTVATPAVAVTTAPACTTQATPVSTSTKWVPNWGANYAAEQAKYMNSGKSSSSSVWKPNYGNNSCSQPIVYVTNSAGRSIGDEARDQASKVKDYALDKHWTVSVSGDWGDCDYRDIEIKASNSKHSRTWTQKTVLVNGGYTTYYEHDGHIEYLDDVKYYLKDRRDD